MDRSSTGDIWTVACRCAISLGLRLRSVRSRLAGCFCGPLKYLRTKETICLVAATKFAVIVVVVSLKKHCDKFGVRICLGVCFNC